MKEITEASVSVGLLLATAVGGIGTSDRDRAPASGPEDVRSFTVLLSGSKDYVCLFTATELRSLVFSVLLRLKLLGTWKHVPSRDDYEFVVVFRLFMLLYWTRYPTDLEQKLKKKRQNIRQNGH